MRYKLKMSIHITVIIFIIAFIGISFLFNDIVHIVIQTVIILGCTLIYINSLFVYYETNEKQLTIKGLFSSRTVEWKDVEHIVKRNIKKIYGEMIIIYGAGKSIGILSWLNNYEELLITAILMTKNNKEINVDEEVLRKLEKKD